MIKTLSLSALALATMGFNSAAHADISDFDSPRIYTGIGYGQYSFEFEEVSDFKSAIISSSLSLTFFHHFRNIGKCRFQTRR